MNERISRRDAYCHGPCLAFANRCRELESRAPFRSSLCDSVCKFSRRWLRRRALRPPPMTFLQIDNLDQQLTLVPPCFPSRDAGCSSGTVLRIYFTEMSTPLLAVNAGRHFDRKFASASVSTFQATFLPSSSGFLGVSDEACRTSGQVYSTTASVFLSLQGKCDFCCSTAICKSPPSVAGPCLSGCLLRELIISDKKKELAGSVVFANRYACNKFTPEGGALLPPYLFSNFSSVIRQAIMSVFRFLVED